MKVTNFRRIDKGGLKAEFELYLEYNKTPLFVIPGWKLVARKTDGKLMVMSPRTLYVDYKTKEQKEGSVFKGRLNPQVEKMILDLALNEYSGQQSESDIPF